MNFNSKIKTDNYFLSQPHQPFFILGIVNAIIFMSLFALSYRNLVNIAMQTSLLHAYSLIFLVFTNFFIGFLFTTFPRFNQSETIPKEYYLKIFYTNALGTMLFLAGVLYIPFLVLAAMGILLLSQIFVVLKLYTIYKKGMAVEKGDSFWILVAQIFGIFGHTLFILSVLGVLENNVSIYLSFYSYLIFLTFVVAQRMIPFFSHSLVAKNRKLAKIVFILLFLKIIFLLSDRIYSIKIFEIVLDIFIGVFTLKEFLRWKLLSLNAPAILWVLHLGLFWFPASFLLSAFSSVLAQIFDIDFYFLSIHLIALGFLTTIFIGFATRVVLGHSGQAPHADNFARNIFLFIQFILLLRAIFSINVGFGWGMNFIFDISVSAWLVLFVLWGYRYGKILMMGTAIKTR